MRKRILVLVDDADLRDLLHLILNGAGYEVQSVESLTGLRTRMARAPRPHLLLLDLALPDGEALAVCRDLREVAPDVPIVVLAAHLPPDIRGEAVSAGCTSFLAKPFDPEAVESAVGDALVRASRPRARAVRGSSRGG